VYKLRYQLKREIDRNNVELRKQKRAERMEQERQAALAKKKGGAKPFHHHGGAGISHVAATVSRKHILTGQKNIKYSN